MKTRTRIPAKVVAKSPQKPIQATLERHSISRDVSKNLKTKTGESNSSLSSHKLSAISLLAKKKPQLFRVLAIILTLKLFILNNSIKLFKI